MNERSASAVRAAQGRGWFLKVGPDAGGLAVQGHPAGDAFTRAQAEMASPFAKSDRGFNFKETRFGIDQRHGTRRGAEHPDRVEQRKFENDPGIER